MPISLDARRKHSGMTTWRDTINQPGIHSIAHSTLIYGSVIPAKTGIQNAHQPGCLTETLGHDDVA